jgi:hypothetical protein
VSDPREEARERLARKIESNQWDHIQDFIRVLQGSRDGSWVWWKNSRCKYVNLRVDMRTGHCILMDRDGQRIDPTELEWQYPGTGTETSAVDDEGPCPDRICTGYEQG